MVTNVYVKFNYDWLHTDKALGNWKSDNNNNKNVCSTWEPFPGPIIQLEINDHITEHWLLCYHKRPDNALWAHRFSHNSQSTTYSRVPTLLLTKNPGLFPGPLWEIFQDLFRSPWMLKYTKNPSLSSQPVLSRSLTLPLEVGPFKSS